MKFDDGYITNKFAEKSDTLDMQIVDYTNNIISKYYTIIMLYKNIKYISIILLAMYILSIAKAFKIDAYSIITIMIIPISYIVCIDIFILDDIVYHIIKQETQKTFNIGITNIIKIYCGKLEYCIDDKEDKNIIKYYTRILNTHLK